MAETVQTTAPEGTITFQTELRMSVTDLARKKLQEFLGDRSLDVPAWLSPAIDELRPGRVLTPRDLPLSPESAVVLCRRLLREGLLEPA